MQRIYKPFTIKFLEISVENKFWWKLLKVQFLVQIWSFCENPIILSLWHVLRKDRGLFVIIKFMQLDCSRFLKHVGCLMRLFRQYDLQNVFMVSSSKQTLKSQRSMILLCFVENMSNDFLISFRYLLILFLCGLYEQLKSNFFLCKLVSIKTTLCKREITTFRTFRNA